MTMQPPDGSSPNPEAEAYLRRLAKESADQVLKGYQAFLLSDIAPELKRAVVEEMQPLIPSRGDLVKEAVDALNAKADTGLGEIRQRIGQIEDVLKKLAGGQVADPAAFLAQGSAPTLQGELSLPNMQKPVNLGQLGAVIDYALTQFLRVQQARISLTDPFTLAAKIRAIDPVKAAIAGQLLYPNPMEQYAPALAGQVAQNTMRQGMSIFIPMLRDVAKQATWQNPASPGSTPSGDSPSGYGGPNAPQGAGPNAPQPQSTAAPPGNAVMTNSGNGPGPQAGGQDTVRVSGPAGGRRAGLRGNFR